MTELRDRILAAWMPGDPVEPAERYLIALETKHAVVSRVKPRTICEIGVRCGYGGYAMLLAAPKARYLGIDNWKASYGDGSVFHEYAKTLLKPFDASLIVVDSHAIRFLPSGLDLVHVDGHHTYDGAIQDMDLCERSGAKWMLVDDTDYLPKVARAVRDWCAKRGIEPEYIRDGGTGSALIRLAA